MQRKQLLLAGLALSSLAATAFAAPLPPLPSDPPLTVGEYGGPSRPLTPAEADVWLRGRALFDKDFSLADGLGTPDMNADSCRACHGDPVMGGAGGLELNVARFGLDNGGAGPYQDLPGGQIASKLRPPLNLRRENPDATADVYEQRQPPTLLGNGLIVSIQDSEILANEDPGDADQDGITGIARRVTPGGGAEEIGRLGWKAQIPTIDDFIKDAMGNECGMTTPGDGRGFAFVTDGDAVSDPEFAGADFQDLSFFLHHLGAPPRGGSTDPLVAQGEALFNTIGCARCHIPTLQGSGGPVHLYSDLLLHNVMKPTFRGMSELGAGVGLYRTPPLWGVSFTAPYLHDGRAETLDEAIRMHGGEAKRIAANYKLLPPRQRQAMILFLEDL
jgi:CxxC motif-containing protein (DUF1111 family)